MIQFYAPEIESTGVLPESDSAHCCRVLRMHEGDEIEVVDGKGNRFRCVIVEAHPKHTAVEIVDRASAPNHWAPKITLAIAPTKNNDRMEWMVEKIVEIGVDEVVLIKCDRSERKVMKPERLEKVMIAAMKQSLKGVLPRLRDMVSIKEFIAAVDCDSQKFFGYCDSAYPRREFAKSYQAGKNVVIMIGPEGDFSPQEVKLAVDAEFIPVTFGQSRLRTETAALYGVTAVHVLEQLQPSDTLL